MGLFLAVSIQFEMPHKRSVKKTMLVVTRVVPEIKEAVKRVASGEGLSTSEWARKLIVIELHKNEALPTVFTGTKEEN